MNYRNKKEKLEHCLREYENMLKNDECKVIELVRYNGTKGGIGNKEIIQKVLMLLISESKQQLAEL